MTQEEIQKYADELAQQYFPDEANIWARENLEAKFVSEACMRMAKHIEQELIKKACDWISQLYTSGVLDWKNCDSIIEDFKKAIGVKVQSYSYEDDVEIIETLREIDFDGYISALECETLKNIYNPYLFPLSSMTEEQKEEFVKFADYETKLEELG